MTTGNGFLLTAGTVAVEGKMVLLSSPQFRTIGEALSDTDLKE